jgi:hypothetical protein
LTPIEGYYRTTYDNWERVIKALTSSDSSLAGRTQLVDDAFALSSGSALSYNTTLRLALALLGRSPLYRDWLPVQRGLQDIKNNLWGYDLYSSYKVFWKIFAGNKVFKTTLCFGR